MWVTKEKGRNHADPGLGILDRKLPWLKGVSERFTYPVTHKDNQSIGDHLLQIIDDKENNHPIVTPVTIGPQNYRESNTYKRLGLTGYGHFSNA
jgi:hypothetical protein